MRLRGVEDIYNYFMWRPCVNGCIDSLEKLICLMNPLVPHLARELVMIEERDYLLHEHCLMP